MDRLVKALHLELHELLDRGIRAPAPHTAARHHPPQWLAAPQRHSELHRTTHATYQAAPAHPEPVPVPAARTLAIPLARQPPADPAARAREHPAPARRDRPGRAGGAAWARTARSAPGHSAAYRAGQR
ncbi:hypothetical protein [Streptomyces sp. NPDC055749]